jgi:hypothetical protein
MQQIARLRCTACDGWGWVTIPSVVDHRHQAGEKNCPRCGGDGTEPGRLQPVKVRRLGKQQKSMTVKQLEEEILKWTNDRDIGCSLDFTRHLEEPSSYEWLSPEDAEKANDCGAWTLNMHGGDIVPSLSLAASSLPLLVQMFAQYELQPVQLQPRGLER